jgi:hypothetical protein
MKNLDEHGREKAKHNGGEASDHKSPGIALASLAS